MRRIANILGAAVIAAGQLTAPAAAQGLSIVPDFSIWDVEIGGPVSLLPEMDTGIIACGTNGGPPSVALQQFEDFATCPAEPSGLREVQFSYDDEQDYIAKALDVEYKVAQGGTSAFAHPVIVSVLVDAGGIVRGIRIVTDDRVPDRTRRVAVSLGRNFKARFAGWDLACEDIPPRQGENPVGRQFVHELCKGKDDALGQTVEIESYYLRKRGQEALNRETQQINKGYYASVTRMELLQADALK